MTENKAAVTAVIPLSLKDKTALHASYMPFIKGGGLYAISPKPHQLGDDVILSLRIESIGKKFAIPGKVVWLAPQSSSGKQGVGIRFAGATSKKVRMVLESVLGDLATKPSAYHTY